MHNKIQETLVPPSKTRMCEQADSKIAPFLLSLASTEIHSSLPFSLHYISNYLARLEIYTLLDVCPNEESEFLYKDFLEDELGHLGPT